MVIFTTTLNSKDLEVHVTFLLEEILLDFISEFLS
jgi:hypothetical protein